MERLTTHVLDTAKGCPAAGVRVCLYQEGKLLIETVTNADGRCDSPLLTSPAPGAYELVFSVGDYFRKQGIDSPFLDEIPIHFRIQHGQSYHVPLLCSPWSYSTYRGS